MKEEFELLRAVFQLLRKQDKCSYVLNMHEQIVSLDGEVECDGSAFRFYLENGLNKVYENHDRLEQENAELREHLGNLITESTRLAEFKNETLRKRICSTDLDEPEWHDYQTIGEAAECLGKLLNK